MGKNGQDVILQFPYQGDAISKFDDPRLQDLGDDEFTFDGKRNLLLTLPQKKNEKRSVDYFEERGIGQLKDDGDRHSVGYLEERGVGQAKDDGGRRSLGYLEERGVGQSKDDGDSKDEDDDDDDDGLKVSDLKWIMI